MNLSRESETNAVISDMLNLIGYMKHKKSFIILFCILILLVILVIVTGKKPINQPDKTKQPAQTNQTNLGPSGFSTLLQDNSDNLDLKEFYYLNRVDTQTGVNGYTWLGNKLIYSTNKGIYNGDNNQLLTEVDIDQIYWNQNGQALLKQSDQWYEYSAKDNQIIKVNTDLPEAEKFIWVNNQEIAAVNKSLVLLINLETDQKTTINITNNLNFAGISQDGKIVGAFDPVKENLILTDRSGNKQQTINFPDSKKVAVSWLDDNNFIVVAASTPDSLGRVIDYIWLADIDGSKKFLANSQPIPKKLDLSIPVFASGEKNVIGLVENKGTVWILSLIANRLPSYQQQTINFFDPSTKGH